MKVDESLSKVWFEEFPVRAVKTRQIKVKQSPYLKTRFVVSFRLSAERSLKSNLNPRKACRIWLSWVSIFFLKKYKKSQWTVSWISSSRGNLVKISATSHGSPVQSPRRKGVQFKHVILFVFPWREQCFAIIWHRITSQLFSGRLPLRSYGSPTFPFLCFAFFCLSLCHLLYTLIHRCTQTPLKGCKAVETHISVFRFGCGSEKSVFQDLQSFKSLNLREIKSFRPFVLLPQETCSRRNTKFWKPAKGRSRGIPLSILKFRAQTFFKVQVLSEVRKCFRTTVSFRKRITVCFIIFHLMLLFAFFGMAGRPALWDLLIYW